VAQSIGGLVAARVALAGRVPVRRLVLAATSGGLELESLGASEWRTTYRRAHPRAPAWVTRDRFDLSGELPALGQPTLLLWGDADPISPVAVGEELARILPDAELVVLRGGTHWLAAELPDAAAAAIRRHLEAEP
jgi:pimeloyl-ACP methyl ester carboxylesterase